ncbi:MAG: hypothetical protein R3B72_24580 [Polyangiaceae bacterium]
MARPDADFTWSSWLDQVAALNELDARIRDLEQGHEPSLGVLFAPTGPMQELAISSGWGEAFLALAERYDEAMACEAPDRDPR